MKKSKLNENLRALLEDRKITEANLAKELNISSTTLWRLATDSDITPNLSSLIPIAQYFNVTIDQLLGYRPLYRHTAEGKIKIIKEDLALVPVVDLNYDNVHGIENIRKNLTPSDWTEWVTVNLENNDLLVAFPITSDEYISPLSQNSLQIVQLTDKFQNGDILLIEVKANKSVVFKECFFAGNQLSLLNLFQHQLPNDFFSEETHHIHGKVMQSIVNHGNNQ